MILLEMVKYQKGHKNSKGEDAPWTIVSCKTGKILSSHKSKKAADEHLQQMEYYKHAKAESVFSEWLDGRNSTPVVEACKKVLTESADAPSLMCWGRGYGENQGGMSMDVVDSFNSRVTRNDPYTGGLNPVLQRVNQFTANNASKFTVDNEPELDKYVDTVFVDDMGPEAFTINGQNPYRMLEKIRDGEEIDIPSHGHGVAVTPSQVEPTAVTEEPEDEFVNAFDTIFKVGH